MWQVKYMGYQENLRRETSMKSLGLLFLSAYSKVWLLLLRKVTNREDIIPGITLKLENKSGNQYFLQGVAH